MGVGVAVGGTGVRVAEGVDVTARVGVAVGFVLPIVLRYAVIVAPDALMVVTIMLLAVTFHSLLLGEVPRPKLRLFALPGKGSPPSPLLPPLAFSMSW